MAYKWKPLQRAAYPIGYSRHSEVVRLTMTSYACSAEEAIARLDAYDADCEVWKNDLYQVQTRKFICEEWGSVEMMHLNIRRVDGAAVFDWRHRQLIKNQLLGEQCEAVEVYPAEDRLVDTSNKYHLFGFTNPQFRFPFGIDFNRGRDVVANEVKGPPGIRQRGL